MNTKQGSGGMQEATRHTTGDPWPGVNRVHARLAVSGDAGKGKANHAAA